jgi:hypothetical protein
MPVGNSYEYALAIQLSIFDQPIVFAEHGSNSFAESRGETLPQGAHIFPLASIGSSDEFPRHLERFDEDLWNLAGCDIQRIRPAFSVQL